MLVGNDDAVTHNANLGVAGDLAFQHIATGNGADAGDLEHLAHLRAAQLDLAGLWRQHTLHRGGDLLDGIVDDAVHAHVNAFALSHVAGYRVRTDVESNNDRAAGLCQHDIRLADRADCAVDNLDANLGVAQLLQRLLDGLNRALNVRLDDDRQLLGLAFLNLLEQIIQCNLLVGAELLLLGLLASLFHQLTGQLLVLNSVEFVARCRYVCQTGDLNRRGWAGALDLLASGVGHHTHAANRCAGNHAVAGLEGTVLYQNGRNRSAALVEFCLDDRALGQTVRVGFELLYLGNQQDILQQVLDTHFGLGRYRNADDVAAPLFRNQLILGQLLHDALRICFRLIHLVDGDDDRNARRLGVVDRLDGLRHDAVVRRDNQNCDVGDVGAAGTHGGERLMARGVQEGDQLAVDVDLVRTDVLGDAARLGGGDVGVADCVEDGGLAVVDVSHNNNNRWALYLLLVLVLAVIKEAVLDGDDNLLLNLRADFHGNQGSGVVVDDVRNRLHLAQHHQAFDNLRRLNLQFQRKLADGDLVRQGDVQFLAALTLHLQTFELLHLLVLLGHEVFLLVVSAADFLLLYAVVPLGHILRRDVLIAFVVFVQVDIGRAHIDVADHLAVDVLVQLRIDGRSLARSRGRLWRLWFCRLLWTVLRLFVAESAAAVVSLRTVIEAAFALRLFIAKFCAAVCAAVVSFRAIVSWTIGAAAFSGAIFIGAAVRWTVLLRSSLFALAAACFRCRALGCLAHILFLPLCLRFLHGHLLIFLLRRFSFCVFFQSRLLFRLGSRDLLFLLWLFFYFFFFLRLFCGRFFGSGLFLFYRLGLDLISVVAIQIVLLVLLRVGLKHKVELLVCQDGRALFFSRKVFFQQIDDILHLHIEVLGDLIDSIFIVYHENIRLLFIQECFCPVRCCARAESFLANPSSHTAITPERLPQACWISSICTSRAMGCRQNFCAAKESSLRLFSERSAL